MRVKKLENQIKHLYILTDVLSEVQIMPIKVLYGQIRHLDPEKIITDRKEVLVTFRDAALKKFSESREALRDLLKDEHDPIERKRREKTLLELETVITLISTLDKDDSEQYIEDVLKNMAVSLDKIVGMQDDDY
jgi:hypothetical protein